MTPEKLTDSYGHEFTILGKHALQCTEGGANKFWQCAIAKHENPDTAVHKAKPWVVILLWGKQGTIGQRQDKRFTSEHKALAYMAGRLRDKERKKYVHTDAHTLKQRPDSRIGLTEHIETEWDLF